MSDDTLTIPGPRGDTGYVDGKHSWSPWTGKHTRPREYYHPHPEVLALVDQWRQAMGQAPLAA